MVLSEKLLYLVAMIQSYKDLLINKANFEYYALGKPITVDFYKETEKFYYGIGTEALNALGLKANVIDFRRVYHFKITAEINMTEFKQLDRFCI